jgi:Tol biopolymer transport system component
MVWHIVRRLRFGAIALPVCMWSQAPPAAKPPQPQQPGYTVQVSRTVVCRIELTILGESLLVSPNSARVAYILGVGGDGRFEGEGDNFHQAIWRPGGKVVLAVDGVRGPQYDRIVGIYSSEPYFVFSPDSRRIAYVAGQTGAVRLVVDGKEGPVYSEIAPQSVRFSADGKRLAYAARTAAGWTLVVDGVESPPHESIAGTSVRFSPDGKRIAFVASAGKSDYLVVDGVKGKTYERIGLVRFSSDGNRIAFEAATAEGQRRVVVDGVEGKESYLEVGTGGQGFHPPFGNYFFEFSPDGKRLAFLAHEAGGDFRAVVDGQAGAGYNGMDVSNVLFSRDSKHFAYVASSKTGKVVVLDGREVGTYSSVVESSLTFGGGGQRLAYTAQDPDGRWAVFVNGKEGAAYDDCRAPVFSPDGKRLAYTARRGLRDWLLVVDGAESPPYEAVGKPVFSPDGLHVAAVVLRDKKMSVLIDKIETEPFQGFLRGSALVFDSADSAHTLALDGLDVLLVRYKIAGSAAAVAPKPLAQPPAQPKPTGGPSTVGKK